MVWALSDCMRQRESLGWRGCWDGGGEEEREDAGSWLPGDVRRSGILTSGLKPAFKNSEAPL